MQNSRFLRKMPIHLKKVCYKVSLCEHCHRQHRRRWLEFWRGAHGEPRRWVGGDWSGVWRGVPPPQPTRGFGERRDSPTHNDETTFSRCDLDLWHLTLNVCGTSGVILRVNRLYQIWPKSNNLRQRLVIFFAFFLPTPCKNGRVGDTYASRFEAQPIGSRAAARAGRFSAFSRHKFYWGGDIIAPVSQRWGRIRASLVDALPLCQVSVSASFRNWSASRVQNLAKFRHISPPPPVKISGEVGEVSE